MRNKFLRAVAMIVFLASSGQALAESGAKWLNGGKPVQARVFEPAKDRNHEPIITQRSELQRLAQRDHQGKPQHYRRVFQY